MSLTGRTFRSVAWNLSTNLGSRVVTILGTLVLTRYLAPDAYGEVMVASTVVVSANQLFNLGVGHYVVARPTAERDVMFHATAYYLFAGALVTLLVVALRGRIGALLDAPGMERFVPGMALALSMERLAFMPERVLVREMRFRRIGITRSLGEIAYTAFSLAVAIAGGGGHSVVAGNIARSFVRGVSLIGSVERRAWLSPCRPSRRITSEMFAFAVPMWLSTATGFAARRWDNLLVAKMFGPASAGLYNLSYSLAEIPAVNVGEQIGDVLLPSFAHAAPSRRPAALLRSIGLLALLIFPMGIGLGAIAPTLTSTLLAPEWREIGPMLTVLCALSIAKPIAWVSTSYLQTQNRPRSILALEGSMMAALLLSIATFGRFGLLWVCAAVGVAYGAYALASLAVVSRVDQIGFGRLIRVIRGPLLACLPMTGAILAVRAVLDGVPLPGGVALAAEVAVGAVSYAGAVFLLSPGLVREAFGLASDALRASPAADASR